MVQRKYCFYMKNKSMIFLKSNLVHLKQFCTFAVTYEIFIYLNSAQHLKNQSCCETGLVYFVVNILYMKKGSEDVHPYTLTYISAGITLRDWRISCWMPCCYAIIAVTHSLMKWPLPSLFSCSLSKQKALNLHETVVPMLKL